MFGQLFTLIGASLTFVRENDRKTTVKAVMSRDAHPLLQFMKYGVCGVVAFTTHQIVAFGLGQTVFLDREFDVRLQRSAAPVLAGEHAVVLTRAEGGVGAISGIAVSHKGGVDTVDLASVDSQKLTVLQERVNPLWNRTTPLEFDERVAVLEAIDDLSSFKRKEIRQRHIMINNTIAFLTSGFVAYFLNVMFVFTPGRHAKWMEVFLFILVSAVSYVGGYAAVQLIFNWFGDGRLLSVFANFGFAFASALVNFVCRKFLIFAK